MTDTNQPTESNEVEFHEKVPTPVGRTRAARAGIVAGAAFLLVVGAAAAMGASPSPSTGANPAASTAPGSSTAPNSSTAPGTNKSDGDRHGFGRGGFGRFGFRDITITAINGSDLSLKTDDGWTRTITATSTTTITKGGATITVGDLAVGDQIVFAQSRAADGTYSVTAIKVVLPSIGGQVTAVTGDTITVTQKDGTTATIHVGGDRRQGRFLRRGRGHAAQRWFARCRIRADRRPRRQGARRSPRPEGSERQPGAIEHHKLAF